ncbi:MAG: SUMF1/EgtB/PvdO family nonheme iron enzyme [Candidatus Cloacimonadaceae bacterium]
MLIVLTLMVTTLLVVSSGCITCLKIVAKPEFNPSGGNYYFPQDVTITCETLGATIHYTLDGSNPNSASTEYSGPISISQTTTIKAKAFREGWANSATASATYAVLFTPVQMVTVPGGTYIMGDTRGEGWISELPTHSVTLNPFQIGKYEVTQAEWQAVMGWWDPDPGAWGQTYGVGDNYPVYYVSWYEILKYCNARSLAEGLTPVYSISGSTDPADWGPVPTFNNSNWNAVLCDWNANGYRLPTEAEWEYAARGATNDPDHLYSGNDVIGTVAWYQDNGENSTHPVGAKAANGIGVYDMSGNVYEWCWDWYAWNYYSSSPANNPAGSAYGNTRLLRGGSYYGNASLCRVSTRNSFEPNGPFRYGGFRLCRAID